MNDEDSRREHPRSVVAATAHLVGDDQVFWVENLSAGGVLLVGGSGPPCGEQVLVVLNAATFPMVQLEAEVVRRVTDAQGRAEFAVCFQNLPAWIEDELMALYELQEELEKAAA